MLWTYREATVFVREIVRLCSWSQLGGSAGNGESPNKACEIMRVVDAIKATDVA